METPGRIWKREGFYDDLSASHKIYFILAFVIPIVVVVALLFLGCYLCGGFKDGDEDDDDDNEGGSRSGVGGSTMAGSSG